MIQQIEQNLVEFAFENWWHEGEHPFRDLGGKKSHPLNMENARAIWLAAARATPVSPAPDLHSEGVAAARQDLQEQLSDLRIGLKLREKQLAAAREQFEASQALVALKNKDIERLEADVEASREQALEEAAQECDRIGSRYSTQFAVADCAEAIRALKGKAAPATKPEAVAPVVPNPIDCLREAMTAAGAPTDLRPMLVGYFSNAWNKRIGTSATVPAAPVAVAPVAGEGLTEAEIDDLAFGYCPSGEIGELRELVRAVLSITAERQPQAAAHVAVTEVAYSYLMSQDLYDMLLNIQNGIDSPATCQSANRLIIWLDKVRAAIQQSQQAGKEGA